MKKKNRSSLYPDFVNWIPDTSPLNSAGFWSGALCLYWQNIFVALFWNFFFFFFDQNMFSKKFSSLNQSSEKLTHICPTKPNKKIQETIFSFHFYFQFILWNTLLITLLLTRLSISRCPSNKWIKLYIIWKKFSAVGADLTPYCPLWCACGTVVLGLLCCELSRTDEGCTAGGKTES